MRHYAIMEGTGERVLHALSCDAGVCTTTIQPCSEIADSGWTRCGAAGVERDYCPRHRSDAFVAEEGEP